MDAAGRGGSALLRTGLLAVGTTVWREPSLPAAGLPNRSATLPARLLARLQVRSKLQRLLMPQLRLMAVLGAARLISWRNAAFIRWLTLLAGCNPLHMLLLGVLLPPTC